MDLLYQFIISIFGASVLICNIPDVNGGSYQDLKSLTDTLLNSSRYHTDSKPRLDQSDILYVYPYFKLVSVVEVNDVTESFICNGFMAVIWYDDVRTIGALACNRGDLLTWAPSLYGGIDELHPLPESVWRPRMQVLNTLDVRDPFGDDPSPVSVNSIGRVLWVPGALFKISCDLNLLTYPFDEQVCALKIMPMSYQIHELIYGVGSSELDFYTPNGEWELVSTNVSSYSQDVDTLRYSMFEVTFTLKRRPTFFVVNILLPVVLLSLLNMFVFFIPADSGEKVSYGITVVLAMSVFLSIVSSMLPRSSDVVPNVTIYLFILLVVSVLTVIDSILIVFFSNLEEKQATSIKVSRQYSQAGTKITNVLRAVRSMRPSRKVTSHGMVSGGMSVTSIGQPEVDEDQGQWSKQGYPQTDEDIPPRLEKDGKLEAEGEEKDRPTQVNKYKVIGKYIDFVSLVVFLLIWLIVTLWYFTSVL